jgi:hypothetical protein
MLRELEGETADALLGVIAAQKDHLRRLDDLRSRYQAAKGDVDLPPEVEAPRQDAARGVARGSE